MAERRSLGEALADAGMNPAAMAFITGTKNQVTEVSVSPGPERRVDEVKSKPVRRADPPSRQVLVPVTTRLRRETTEALRRICFERKMNGEPVATQQEIIEEATSAWLRRHGY